jgi:predicted RNase H-like nuclease (RuvC/YqgF family)
MISMKYDILYSLNYETSPESVEELYDEIEQNIKKLKDERDKIKLKMYQKEERRKKEIKKITDAIDVLRFNYREIPEDRKELYLKLTQK